MDMMGWCLGFEAPLVVQQLLENHFRKCRVLVLVGLA